MDDSAAGRGSVSISNPISDKLISRVNVQSLPLEIVQDIFESLLFPYRLLKVHLAQHRNASPQLWRTLPYICRKWHGIALSVLYASIELSRYNAIVKLHKSLRENPRLRPLIRRLRISVRINVTVPPTLYTLFLQIIELAEDLQEIASYCLSVPEGDSVGFPVPFDKHRNLASLALYGDKSHTLDHTVLRCISSLRYLRHLTMANMILAEKVRHSSVPILQSLESITFEWDHSLEMLDDWLCEHPKLHTLRMYETSAPSSPPRLLSKKNLICLEMMHWHWNTPSLSAWFSACTSLRKLRITEDVLLYHPTHIPIHLEELIIDFVCYWVDSRVWEAYLNREPNISKIIFISHREIAWYRTLGDVFLTAAKEHGLKVEYQFPDCDCMERYAKKAPFRSAPIPISVVGKSETEIDIERWERAAGCKCEAT